MTGKWRADCVGIISNDRTQRFIKRPSCKLQHADASSNACRLTNLKGRSVPTELINSPELTASAYVTSLDLYQGQNIFSAGKAAFTWAVSGQMVNFIKQMGGSK